MSITDHFGGRGRGNQRRPEPAAMLPPPRPVEEVAGILHPTLAAMSRSLEEADSLRAALVTLREQSNEEIRQLRADLDVEKRCRIQTQTILDQTRAQLEVFRSYAVTIRTHLDHLAVAAVKANDVAMQVNADPLPERGDKEGEEGVKKALEKPEGETGQEHLESEVLTSPRS